MADNGYKNGKQFPYPLVDEGKGYSRALVARAQAILNGLINLLPSNYESSVVGPNYTIYMKAMATEMARLTIILESLRDQTAFSEVQSEFLWQVVGYLVFINGQIPELDFDDESFRAFLLTVIDIYFQGSTPAALAQGVALFTDEDFVIRENFLEERSGNSPFDISDQFGFFVDFELQAQFPPSVFELDRNIQLLLRIIKPAHTLYRLRFLFADTFDTPNDVTDSIADWELYNYYYDEVRCYCEGMAGWESDTGAISGADLTLFSDPDTTRPLYSVRKGATLLIPEGPNNGRYTVIEEGTSIRVFPRFQQAENPVSYSVEVDRLGCKRENPVAGEVHTFPNLDRLTVDAGGPYSTNNCSIVALAATSNGTGVTYTWDLDQNNVFETTGQTPDYIPTQGGDYTVWVKATDALGRQAKDSAVIQVRGCTAEGVGNLLGTASVGAIAEVESPSFVEGFAAMVGTAGVTATADDGAVANLVATAAISAMPEATFDFGTPVIEPEPLGQVASLESNLVVNAVYNGAIEHPNGWELEVWDATNPAAGPLQSNTDTRSSGFDDLEVSLLHAYTISARQSVPVIEPQIDKFLISDISTPVWTKSYPWTSSEDITTLNRPVQLAVTKDDSMLLASTRSAVYSLDPANGDILGHIVARWTNWNSTEPNYFDAIDFCEDEDRFLVWTAGSVTSTNENGEIHCFSSSAFNAGSTAVPYNSAVDTPLWKIDLMSYMDLTRQVSSFQVDIQRDRQPGGGWWVFWGTDYNDNDFNGFNYRRYGWHVTKAGSVDVFIDFETDVHANHHKLGRICCLPNGQVVVPMEYTPVSTRVSAFVIFDTDGSVVSIQPRGTSYATNVWSAIADTDLIFVSGSGGTVDEAVFIPLVGS